MKAMNRNCTACGGSLEKVGAGRYVCEFCGSEYFDEAEAKLDAKSEKAEKKKNKDKKKQEEDDEITYVEDIVFDTMWEYFDQDDYGVEIREDADDDTPLKKEDKARELFGIDDDETVYMIYDETFFGSMKEGYALTTAGFYAYYKSGGQYFVDWEDLPDVKIKAPKGSNTDLKLDGYTMCLTGNDSRDNTYNMLCDIADEVGELDFD